MIYSNEPATESKSKRKDPKVLDPQKTNPQGQNSQRPALQTKAELQILERLVDELIAQEPRAKVIKKLMQAVNIPPLDDSFAQLAAVMQRIEHERYVK
jgi:hypothetical protein